MTRSGADPAGKARHDTTAGRTAEAQAFAADLFLCGAALVALSLPTLTRPRPQPTPPRATATDAMARWEGEGGATVPPPAPPEEAKPGWVLAGLAMGLGAGAAAAVPMSETERRAIRRAGTAFGRVVRHQMLNEISWLRALATDTALDCLDAVDDALRLVERRVARTAEHAADAVATRLGPRQR